MTQGRWRREHPTALEDAFVKQDNLAVVRSFLRDREAQEVLLAILYWGDILK
jgi:hypothetical protein